MANKLKNPFCSRDVVHFLVKCNTTAKIKKKKDNTHKKNWPRGPPTLLYNGYWVFFRGKAAGAWR